MTTRSAVILGACVVLAAGLHAGVAALWPRPAPRPLHVGRVSGDITYRIGDSATGRYKAGGCRVELFDDFVLVYIDARKVPTWTDDYVLPIPWRQIESMTLLPE